MTLLEHFDFEKLSRADEYLRLRGAPPTVNWQNLEGYLSFDDAWEVERENLLHALVAFDDPGLDSQCFENPAWIIMDHIWLRGVTDLSTRTNEGIEEEKAARLTAIPVGGLMTIIGPREGVKSFRAYSRLVKSSDGQGIERNKRGRWVRLSDKRKRVSREEVESSWLECEPEEARGIRHDAIILRQSRDNIGQLIETLRREPAISLEAEIDGQRVDVNISPQSDAVSVVAEAPDEEESSSENALELLTDDDVKALAKKLYVVRLRLGSDAGRAQAYLHLIDDQHLNDIQARNVLAAMNCYQAVYDFTAGEDLKEGRRQAKARAKRTGTRCFFCAGETTV